MSFNRYLEFDSSYRDRSMYSNPASFVVDISQSGQKTRENAKDPVSNASPILVWNTSFDETTAATSVVITTIDTTLSPSDSVTFIINATANDLRNVVNYYVGAVLQLTDATPSTIYRRITAYQRISTTQAQVTVDTALPSTFVTTSGLIANPTGATDSDTVPKVFIPASEAIHNFYVGYLIQNVLPGATAGQSFTITAFDQVTHLATISGNTTATWNSTDLNLVIRKQLPSNIGVLLGVSTDGKALQLAVTASDTSGIYTSSFLRMTEPVPTNTAFSTAVAPYSQERRIVNYIAGSGTFIAITTGASTFTLDSTASNIDNFYVGCFITNTSRTPTQTRLISTYNGTTKSGTVSVVWGASVAIGDIWAIRTAFLQNPFTAGSVSGSGTFAAIGAVADTFTLDSGASNINSFYVGASITNITQTETRIILTYVGATRAGTVSAVWGAGVLAGDVWMISSLSGGADAYELEYYTRENCVPFSYNGSLVSCQEMVCYEIELLNLILPNTVLNSGRGGRPIFYPYMYVELQQVSSSSGGAQRGVINSNNPFASKMMFRAVLDDTTQPVVSPFIKIDGDGMNHVLKFKPNDSFKFAVYCPNGDLFLTVATDTSSPTEPNPLVQISACFAFKRV